MGAENPMRFAKAGKILRHGFEVVAVEATNLEGLARDFQTDAREEFLDEIRRPREARGIVAKIALLEGKGLRNLKKAAFDGTWNLRGLEWCWRLFRHEEILEKSWWF